MEKDTVRSILNEINLPFKESTAGLNFRCPICGDSKTHKKKRRGWILFKNDRINYFCHNCSISISFQKFLKEYHKSIYLRYFSKFNEKKKISHLKTTEVKELVPGEELIHEDLTPILNDATIPLWSKQTIRSLQELQLITLRYLISRKIDTDKIGECYVGYKDYVNPETKEILNLRNRIIIPYKFKDKIYAFQGRTLTEDKNISKYLTIKGKNEIKIYNFFNVNKNKTVYVTEGPIDSWFIDNAISVSGSVAENGPIIKLIMNTFKDVVFIFDNDKAGYDKIKKFLRLNYKCFLWEKEWNDCKDLNDVVIKKCLTKEVICDIINKNTLSGMVGLIKLKFKKKGGDL